MNYIDESTQKHIDELVKSLNKVRKENHLLTKENKSLKKQLLIHNVSSRTFSKVGLKNAYLQGYRKRAIMSGLKYDNISEQNAIVEFNNWFDNLYGY